MTLHIASDTASLSLKLAEYLKDQILETLQQQERFTLVLSGGSTPKQLYDLLAEPPFRDEIPWEKIHFFWGDERFVPFEDERNNARMAYETLLNKVNVRPENIHVMRTDLDPEAAVLQYESLLKAYFGECETTFDLVLLGMGDDAHTLSLFPGTAVIHEMDKWVHAFFLKAQEMYRITLTAPVVNKAARVVFLTAGANKASALKQVLEGEKDLDQYPSQIIQPENGALHWFIDTAAASLLTN